jgi:pimeloyl-ACP methyl ester carboxylesterase
LSAIRSAVLSHFAADVTSDLHRISAPTLVLSAAHDPISPPALGRALAAAIPGARYDLLSDQAHGAPILAAETVNALLLAHLDSVEGRTSIHEQDPAEVMR